MNAITVTQQPLRFPAHPVAGLAGTSLKHEHLASIAADPGLRTFFEVHAENYMGAGGPPHRVLESIRRDFPVSLHGVCMSIGGPQPLDTVHLDRFAWLVERYEPALVSEHLAWSTHGDIFFNDLLPLPYTETTLRSVAAHISEMQDRIRRPILLENPASYAAFRESTLGETDFLRQLARRTGCGLLLDLNNVFVSAINQGQAALDYLEDFPIDRVGEIHLAGHAVQQDETGAMLLIDSHDRAVASDVWSLFGTVLTRCGAVPTLIEWDSHVPEWPILRAEADAAQQMLDGYGHDRG